jgi:hypothetical protein
MMSPQRGVSSGQSGIGGGPRFRLTVLLCLVPAALCPGADRPVDFNRDVRPILAANCYICHGPDDKQRQADLRLDKRDGALAERHGTRAVVAGKAKESELIRRVAATDEAERMPPAETGKRLSAAQVETLARWIDQGAPYAAHWAYVPPARPSLPAVKDAAWARRPLDRFVLARLEAEGLTPSPEADRYTLIRRVSLDLTGLPPSLDEVDEFVADAAPDAYERLVDRLLAAPAYGEHWARQWLDLARYADSAGYADDPPRTIWAYRDYVIDSFNEDAPFDRFTIEQLAGDLLPGAGDRELVATAFHRNTQTNNEGGTSDEEYRNVAIVDRVNTTLAVWMGTTMACAQCHNHKYDPFSQEEYFRLFAFFNSTEDADRTDESPYVPLYSEEAKRRKADVTAETARLETVLKTPTPETTASQAAWEALVARDLPWRSLRPQAMETRSGATWSLREDDSVFVERDAKKDAYHLVLPLPGGKLTALQIEALPDPALPDGGPGHAGGNFVLTRVVAAIAPASATPVRGRYVRIELPGKDKILSLAEVQVFAGGDNLALRGKASQSSTDFDGPARLAVDGNVDGRFADAKSTTHTAISVNPWWEVDLGAEAAIDRVVIWNRTDGGLHARLADFQVAVLDGDRRPVREERIAEPPNPELELFLSGARGLAFASAYADFAQDGFEPQAVLDTRGKNKTGWAIAGGIGKPHALTLLPASAAEVAPGSRLSLTLEQVYPEDHHTLGRFRVAACDEARAGEVARVPSGVLTLVRKAAAEKTEADLTAVSAFYLRTIAPQLEPERRRLAELRAELAGIKPLTTVPILRDLAADQKRVTRIQQRGNFLDLGKEVHEGLPAAFHPLPEGTRPDRMALARWLVDPRNPLTARVVANRYWEAFFGTGIVATSEEFGSQGELPSHPELLDWLAVELVDGGWRLKQLIRGLVTSATYRQNSRATRELLERDRDNRLLARGPRVRLSAEAVRDQALFAAGLLSRKMHGPPVRPPQPSFGLTAAFGGGTDWQTSEGEDRYRRGIYTTWRRSNPYPSMTTFDAPNREVCTVRRSPTNSPLQALVTLNDPVYVEAAQGLARRMAKAGGTARVKAAHGFRLVLARSPTEDEVVRLAGLFDESRARLAAAPEKAQALATVPLGPVPEGGDPVELAAWTVAANVILNLDEALMKR